MLKDVRITDAATPLGAVVVVRDKKMKEGWCLATSLDSKKATEVTALYGRRFTIEESFRDAKDLHFGLGLSATHIRDAVRRDRLLLLVAMAIALLTLLGAAAEKTGLDRMLKANTVAKRTRSLFRQGLMLWDRIPNEREDRLVMLIQAFDESVREHAFFRTASESCELYTLRRADASEATQLPTVVEPSAAGHAGHCNQRVYVTEAQNRPPHSLRRLRHPYTNKRHRLPSQSCISMCRQCSHSASCGLALPFG